MANLRNFLRLALLGVFLSVPQGASAAINLVQKVEAPPQETLSGITSSSATYASLPTAGNLLVAIVAGDVTGTLTAPIGWSEVINQPFAVDTVGSQVFQLPSQAIFYRVALIAEPQLVTFTYGSDPDANVAIQLFEYSGINTASPLMASASAAGHADTDAGTPGFQVSSGTVTPTNAPALLLAGFAGRPLDAAPLAASGTGNGNFSAYGNSFAEQTNMSTGEVPCDSGDAGCYGIVSADLVTNALGSFSATATFGPTQGGWRGQIAAFRPASPTAAPANVSGQIVDNVGNPLAGATVRMNGTQNRLAITDAQGQYNFDDVTTNGVYVLTPLRANYVFSPSQRSFNQVGVHTEASFTGSASSGQSNPLDGTVYFVRQQYLDFLGREPDEAGLNFWVNNIESCGSDLNCRAIKRTDTSAAFFFSIEFQETGYLVYRMYEAAFGNLPGAPVPLKRNEFRPDSQVLGQDVVVNQNGWQARLENNKQNFAREFVQRSRFTSAYPLTMTPEQFVDRLFLNAAVIPTEIDRAAVISEFGLAMNTSDESARGRALRRVAENSALAEKDFNRAFVLMQYFGYLRRDPNASPDGDFSGYNFWLNKLDSFNGNYADAEMVQAFLISREYTQRFPR